LVKIKTVLFDLHGTLAYARGNMKSLYADATIGDLREAVEVIKEWSKLTLY